jgi:hypothetical protein
LYFTRIRRQLTTSPGLIGYSLRAQTADKRFWTLSASEDAAALQAFVAEPPHVAIMKALAPYMGGRNGIKSGSRREGRTAGVGSVKRSSRGSGQWARRTDSSQSVGGGRTADANRWSKSLASIGNVGTWTNKPGSQSVWLARRLGHDPTDTPSQSLAQRFQIFFRA